MAKSGRKKKIALVVGHSRIRKGARNKTFGFAEWDLNSVLAEDVKQVLVYRGVASGNKVDVRIVHRENSLRGVVSLINWIVRPTIAISMHCNSFNERASGTETWHWNRSKVSARLAEIWQRHMVDALGLPDRGVKAGSSEDRAGYFLRYTRCFSILSEPFFIDNDEDLERFDERYTRLVEASASAIIEMSGVV